MFLLFLHNKLSCDYNTDMNNIIEKIRQKLIINADEKARDSGQGFFKEKVRLYGVRTAIVSKIGKEYYKVIEDKKKTGIFSNIDLK